MFFFRSPVCFGIFVFTSGESNGNGTMCSKETPQLASSSSSSPPVSASASSNGNGEGKAFKGAAASPPAALGPIPEGDEYSAMTDEEVNMIVGPN